MIVLSFFVIRYKIHMINMWKLLSYEQILFFTNISLIID